MAAGRIPTTANSPLTAKGDLFTYSTGSAKLAVGANDTALVADSTQSTGLAYKTKGVFNGLTTTGDTIYSSSGTTQARLGIGSAGQVLSVSGGIPAWTTPSSGALTLITTSTASAVATSVTLSNCFSATYRNYLVLMDGAQTTNTGDISFQMRASGTTQTTNYYNARIAYGTGATVTASANNNVSAAPLATGSSNKFVLECLWMNPFVGKVQWLSRWWGRNGDIGGSNQGFIDNTTSYDSMVISWGGNYTGTISVYGYGV